MFPLMFSNYLRRYQSFSREVAHLMWKCSVNQIHFGINLMDSLAVGSKAEIVPSDAKEKAGAEMDNQPDNLGKLAMARMKSGYAPPREIYDVRNRGKIDWSTVPEWAKPVDPDVFEGCSHEG
jgi:hypothetical protein